MAELNDETITSMLQDKENGDNSSDALVEKSPLKSDNLNDLTLDGDSSDDDGAVKSVRRRTKRFSDSDSEVEADKENIENKVSPEKASKPNVSSDDDDIFPSKSRIVASDSSDDDWPMTESKSDKYKPQAGNGSSDKNASPKQSAKKGKKRLLVSKDSSDDDQPKIESARISDKRNKLHSKFKSLLTSRSKEVRKSPPKTSKEKDYSSDDSSLGNESIEQSNKQDMHTLADVCDPDTSDDEEEKRQMKKQPKQRSSILISPKKVSKPARISAKQAMENMQKIKSESNRMLREKEVSLPYHRPKALSLKDIMNRRKPAMSADGKALPVKMNSEQLKQYVKLLEQRNKEMMELCKSESEEEENETEEAAANDDNAPEKQSTANECNELITDGNIVGQIDNVDEEKHEENILPAVNEMEESNEQEESNKKEDEKEVSNEKQDNDENYLPDLTIEIVPKEQIIPKTDVDGKHDDVDMKDTSDEIVKESESDIKLATEIQSQLMELRYETEKMINMDTDNVQNSESLADKGNEKSNNVNDDSSDENKQNSSKINNTTVSNTDKTTNENVKDNSKEMDGDFDDGFSDVDINMEDLDSIIENAKNDESAVDSPMLVRDPYNLNKKPKLTGAPGMVIDLDGSNPVGSRKLTGVELLKERFTYFAQLKTPEEKERERELKIKPGMLHIKLKQELEEKISEQRSLEWAKRLEEDKQHQEELNGIRGDESDGDDLEKIEAKLQDKEDVAEESSSESEEEEEEETREIKEKPRKRNPMIDDEAEVSGDDETGDCDEKLTYDDEGNENETEGAENDGDNEEEDSEESSESSEDEEENQSKPRKGRILKAFEDSDDESTPVDNVTAVDKTKIVVNDTESQVIKESQVVKDSQDDILPLAQENKSHSEDLFASQISSVLPSTCINNSNEDENKISDEDCADMTTQTFSILNTNTPESKTDNILSIPAVDIIFDAQAVDDTNLDDVVGMCSGKFTQTQNVIPVESQVPESQCAIGEDILEMCTGKFYNNQFVSQTGESENAEPKENVTTVTEKPPSKKTEEDRDLLDSILKEMDEPNNETNKTKYVFDNPTENEAVSFEVVNHVRKKFTIDSDDESAHADKPAKKKKLKKRKLEKRALQISDDEEEEQQMESDEEAVEYMSDAEEDGGIERIVEYDSEENEVEVKPEKQKKNRKMAEFFEQEAELTSEDEWVGSGDEDERGLDRMEREEGDDDTFHQGRLQRELGQIHMRDVLDQDKREVRLIQELLFEDGDLGDGHRQRRFRWKNLDGEEGDTGAVPDLFAESQEEEFESEEQWRKQRHEREVFLRSLKEKHTEEQDKNLNIDRTTIIKANLCSKTMSSLLLEANGTKVEETVVVEKKIVEPSNPSRALPVFQQNYHGSLLTRGRGALARLAALAMPLAGEADDETTRARGPSSKRNFVFAAVTPPAKDAKAPKRKAENVNVGTPRLIKKLKTDDKRRLPKASLLDHLKAL